MNVFRGEVEATLGGKVRLVKFGTNQLALFTEKHKIDPSDVEFGMAHLRDLVWSALVSGAKKKGEQVDFDEWQVGDWLDDIDQAEFDKIMDAFQKSLPDAGDPKKKSE